MTGRQSARPRSHGDYSPQKAPRRWGAESRPGACPTGTSGRARGSRRRRKRTATVLPVNSVSLSLLPSAPQAGARGVLFSPHPLDKTSFLFCWRYFSPPHVTRGAGPRPGRRLLGNSRPSTPAGLGLWGTLPRLLCPRRACVPVVGPRSKYSLRRGRAFYRFQQVLSGSVATQGYGTVGRRGHPETTTAAGDFE